MLCLLSYGHHAYYRDYTTLRGECKNWETQTVMTMTFASEPSTPVRFDRLRFLRVVRFFAGAFLSVIWWDLVLRQVPGLRATVQRSSTARWRRIAQRFRRLAVHMGGVLIKLGQFLSIRVDVLPPEVTVELAGLQDEVPAESLADVQGVVAAEFGRPVDQVFDWFAPQPEAAASLAQVHKARLVSGEEVVVKVQRPRIETLVETDLAAIRMAVNWLKIYRPIARRVDLNRLFDEFAITTRAELDFVAEGKNAERFAADFASNPDIYIADVYWDYTTQRVLTLENVASIKITDYDAIEAAGISRAQVARRLYDAYLKQIFVTNFVHADPHPGNLFVHPLEPSSEHDGPDDPRPFLLIFVDFGMVAAIPERLRASLRDYAIGIGTRDSHRIVQSYIDAGILLPGADRRRIEEATDALLQRLWGVRMGQFRDVALEEAQFFMREYRDIVYEMPFQLPADILFVGRAVGILSGIATSLDPDFDPWSATIPFAEDLVAEELTRDWRGWLDEIGALARLMLSLPNRVDQLITQAQRGELTVQAALSPDTNRALRRLERSVDRLTWGVISAALLISGTMLRLSEGPGWPSTSLYVLAGLVLLWGITRR
jgi:predicted unusual protein kinase regulating ubiquinone biosynthesis (AarF/ABC1/UbiB family)